MNNQFSVDTQNRIECSEPVYGQFTAPHDGRHQKFLIIAIFDFQSHNNGGCAWWGITAVPWAYPLFLPASNSAYCYGGRQEGINLQLNHKYSLPHYSLLKPHTSDYSVIVKLSKMTLHLFAFFLVRIEHYSAVFGSLPNYHRARLHVGPAGDQEWCFKRRNIVQRWRHLAFPEAGECFRFSTTF